MLFIAGCSDGEEEIGDCENEDQPKPVVNSSAAMHRAVVRVVQEEEDGKVERSVHASFLDHTKVETTSRPCDMTMGDVTCCALTGNVITNCRKGFTEPCLKEKLKVTKVEFEGVAGGTVSLDGTSLFKDGLAVPIYAGTVKLKVTGGGGADEFPSYEMSLPAPELLRLKCPDASLPVGTADFRVCWNAGNSSQGDAIAIVIRTTKTGITHNVQCHEVDDGCHMIRAGVLDWLKVGDGDTFTVMVIRDRAAVKKIDTNRSALFSLRSQVKLTMTR